VCKQLCYLYHLQAATNIISMNEQQWLEEGSFGGVVSSFEKK